MEKLVTPDRGTVKVHRLIAPIEAVTCIRIVFRHMAYARAREIVEDASNK